MVKPSEDKNLHKMYLLLKLIFAQYKNQYTKMKI